VWFASFADACRSVVRGENSYCMRLFQNVSVVERGSVAADVEAPKY
jgi:hypothetical protein